VYFGHFSVGINRYAKFGEHHIINIAPLVTTSVACIMQRASWDETSAKLFYEGADQYVLQVSCSSLLTRNKVTIAISLNSSGMLTAFVPCLRN